MAGAMVKRRGYENASQESPHFVYFHHGSKHRFRDTQSLCLVERYVCHVCFSTIFLCFSAIFYRCTSCEKLLKTTGNRVKYGLMLFTVVVGIALAGCILVGSIPTLIGFKLTGIATNSIASSWQSSMGSVAAGSTFATFQSMGATGVASSLFSSIGAAFSGILAFFGLRNITSKLSWCKCEKPLVHK